MAKNGWSLKTGTGTGTLVELRLEGTGAGVVLKSFNPEQLAEFIGDLERAYKLQSLAEQESEAEREAIRQVRAEYRERRAALEASPAKEPA